MWGRPPANDVNNDQIHRQTMKCKYKLEMEKKGNRSKYVYQRVCVYTIMHAVHARVPLSDAQGKGWGEGVCAVANERE